MTTIFEAGRRRALRATNFRPDKPASEQVVAISTTLTVLSVICLWLLAQIFALGGLEQSRAQDRLHAELRKELAAATAPTGGIIPVGAPVALLRFPELGEELVVAEGTTSGVLMTGPGHRRDTVLPGQIGTSVIYGRSTTYGRPFAPLLDKMAGQPMIVITAQGTGVYTLGPVRRAGDKAAIPGATESRITFVTSEGNGLLGPVSPRSAVYIDATRKGEGFAPPGGRLNAVTDAELPMAIDSSVLPSLALFGGVLVAATIGFIVVQRRFGMVRTWLVGVPVILAVAWKVTDLFAELIPNIV